MTKREMATGLMCVSALLCAAAAADEAPQTSQVPQQQHAGNAAHPKHGRSGTVTPIPTAGLKAEPFAAKGGKQGWRVRIPGGRALATPAVVGDTVYVGGGFGSHEFYAFDATTGKPRWAIRVSDDGPTAAVVADGKVLFNTESCTLFVVDAKTGRQIWSRWLGDPLMSQPAVADGVVYMAYPHSDGHHRLIALGLADGREVFEVKIAGDIISAPVVDGDSVYLTTFDGTVYRHRRADGKILFSRAMQATSAPWIAGGEIHVAQRQAIAKPAGKDAAPAPSPGGGVTPDWNGGTEGEGEGEPEPKQQEGFTTLDATGNVKGEALKARKDADYLDRRVQSKTSYGAKQHADDASVGFGGGAPAAAKVHAAAENVGQASVRGLWEFQGSRPCVVGDANYAAQGDVLRALDAKSGKVVWEKKLAGDVRSHGGHLASPPAFAAGRLVVGTVAGDVVVYDAASGKESARYAAGGEIRFQPALVKGRVFVGTADGTLVMIETGDPALDGWTMWGGGPGHNGPQG